MKKIMKAAIAAGAAGALMLGGAGTFALWNGSGDVSAGTVTTGHLLLNTAAAGVWQDVSVPATPVAFDPVTETIVPGDILEYKQTVTIDADGKNLQGELTVGALDAVPAALVGQVTLNLDADATAPGLTQVGNVISFAAPGSYAVPITITVTFAEGTAGSSPAGTMDEPIDLGALELALDQVRP